LDENNDGHLSKGELRSLLVGIGESVDDDVLNEMMALADLDGDGKVNFKEFVQAALN
jgi:calmodulin